MNRTPDVELVLRDYLAEDGDLAPDRVLEVVAERIASPSLRPRRLHGRPYMNTNLKFFAAAAAVLIAVLGWQLMPGFTGPGSPTEPPTAAPPTSTAARTAQPTPTPGTGILPAGRLVAGHYTMPPIPDFPLTLTADIPEGWTGHPEIPAVSGPVAAVDGVFIGFMVADGLFSDPCHWNVDGTGDGNQPGDIDEGSTVDDLVNALRSNASYTSTAPTAVSVAGFQGVEIELTLPGDEVLQTCDASADDPASPKFLVFGKGFWAQGPLNHWRLFIIDVPGVKLNGTRLITMVNYFGNSPVSQQMAARDIVESFVITP